MANGSKLPHSLRLVIFLLRIALGADFFYLGFTALFNPALGRELRAESLTSLYAWLASAATAGSLHLLFEWAFLIVGACLVIGLFTRLVSVAGIALVLASFLPGILSALTVYQFVSNEVIIVICLLVLIFSGAGNYIGLDRFIHIGSGRKGRE